MDITLVINQLRAYCPPLGGRVGGAADYQTGIETVISITDPVTGGLVYPVAVVIPLEDDVDTDQLLQGDQQIVTETVGVIVEFDATADRRGQTAVSQVEAMKYALFSAILNWHINPARAPRGIVYAGGQLQGFDRGRLFWMFRFSLDVVITDADGFPLSGDPLAVVTGRIPGGTPITAPILFNAHIED